MEEQRFDTVLVVCGCDKKSYRILNRLYDAGFSVVGPVPNASMALALAAQASPTIALVATPPTGRRNAAELASELMRTWGVRSWLLTCSDEPADEAASWAASDKRVTHLQQALGGSLISEGAV